jgi:alginate O-acetyltransferase complex protein AlgI
VLFNSLEFLLFYPFVTILFFLLPHRFRWFHLLAASCIFYMFFIPYYILILLFTIIIDYYAGIWIENAQGTQRRNFLIISLIANIGVLAIFKYYNFFIDNINLLLPTHYSLPFWHIILPIGLSFHTFQAMSYTIEVYRGNQKAERHFGIYALYVMFYPQLVAGPIERPQNILGQFHEKQQWNTLHFIEGLRLMIWGMFKKVVIADRVAIYVNGAFNQPDQHGSFTLLLAAILFSFQIYCDFSGYSDIAIGAARTMGFDLMTNFNRPYFATNIQNFWARWHISLSTWFRDYLYIPLGGNRKGIRRMYINTAIIFMVSGLWHGSNWTFVIWGAIHAIFVVGYVLIKKQISIPNNLVVNILSMLFTFLIVTIAWVFFRADSVGQAWHILRKIAQCSGGLELRLVNGLSIFSSLSLLIAFVSILFMMVVERFVEPKLFSLSQKPIIDFGIITICLCLILMWGTFNKSSFIYFQF